MHHFYRGVALAFLGLSSLSAELPPLSPATMDRYRAAIEPTDAEASFLNIGWQAELSIAVQDAYAARKPLLIYVMNGHPLGCT